MAPNFPRNLKIMLQVEAVLLVIVALATLLFAWFGLCADGGKQRAQDAQTLTKALEHFQGTSFPAPTNVVMHLQNQGMPAVVGTSQAAQLSVSAQTIVVNGTPHLLRLYEDHHGLISVTMRIGHQPVASFNHGSTFCHYLKKVGVAMAIVWGILFLCGLLAVLEFALTDIRSGRSATVA